MYISISINLSCDRYSLVWCLPPPLAKAPKMAKSRTMMKKRAGTTNNRFRATPDSVSELRSAVTVYTAAKEDDTCRFFWREATLSDCFVRPYVVGAL